MMNDTKRFEKQKRAALKAAALGGLIRQADDTWRSRILPARGNRPRFSYAVIEALTSAKLLEFTDLPDQVTLTHEAAASVPARCSYASKKEVAQVIALAKQLTKRSNGHDALDIISKLEIIVGEWRSDADHGYEKETGLLAMDR